MMTGLRIFGCVFKASVRNFSATVTLTEKTTIDFMIRDYDVGDNAGGVALMIRPAATK
jgi:hypothetical protein